MFKIGELVSYSATGVCEVVDIRYEKLTECEMQYYILKPMYQNASTVYVPVENQTLVSRIKPVMTKTQAQSLLDSISGIEFEWIEKDNERVALFRETLRLCDRVKAMAIVKCLFNRQQYLLTLNKNLRTADAQIFRDAQNVLSGEIALALNMDIKEANSLIIQKIQE